MINIHSYKTYFVCLNHLKVQLWPCYTSLPFVIFLLSSCIVALLTVEETLLILMVASFACVGGKKYRIHHRVWGPTEETLSVFYEVWSIPVNSYDFKMSSVYFHLFRIFIISGFSFLISRKVVVSNRLHILWWILHILQSCMSDSVMSDDLNVKVPNKYFDWRRLQCLQRASFTLPLRDLQYLISTGNYQSNVKL